MNSVIKVRKSQLSGQVTLAGAKNSALRLLAASLLTEGDVVLRNYPSELLDAQVHVDMLSALGKSVELIDATTIRISENRKLESSLIWEGRSIRNTLLILGALTARLGAGSVPLPGGCKLGERKYDLHVMLLEALGARIWEEGDQLCAEAPNGLVGAEIHLPMRSTGATENAILAASLAKGVSRIWNPHIRPEILDLVSMLKGMGAKIVVHGQEHIEVIGMDALHAVDHRVIPDNMEAITWLVAASMTGGDIEIRDFPYADLAVVLAHLREAGAKLYQGEESLIVRGDRCYPVEISTGPHPGINSDVQPILAAWAAKARGESRIIDLRFPGRYGYAEEMAKMGVKYSVDGDMLRLHGQGGNLVGAKVRALDLRAGAALTLCGLISEGETEISDAWQISRGYVGFVSKLRSLGADVEA
ncbi:UDP-N-acetylglucosamine 1-carboxyvinyltransferase [Stenotrophomonas sp. ZAC14A_NAIMI4_1]|uniref:UDP-N-acetylglucosamine 1-carboxyvinyltransferase n=1 Tax=Stenotrophomonas sp. ZAC14A_NAIMI4_1 TaxID=2072412 RepID=UPI000D53F263|nr:UDP-N-acetylglucosamine 1-carboxyvinyltransferase [Stenotrophomonas sp. ZAC14A_NAIMI4_1]AWH45400.1 UDP-N-acetylglucosamine 1-carboxyvinyltransferase [Stenotrophomonas sp. ZAC14A_NAIMI4_1]